MGGELFFLHYYALSYIIQCRCYPFARLIMCDLEEYSKPYQTKILKELRCGATEVATITTVIVANWQYSKREQLCD